MCRAHRRDNAFPGETIYFPKRQYVLTDRMSCMPVYARWTILVQHSLCEKREHKTEKREYKTGHISGCRQPLEIKSSALEKIFHSCFNGDSFKA